ncbi:MAG: lipopolysaccharide transport periplasmic protein LptA [Pseudomonadota bacterium]
MQLLHRSLLLSILSIVFFTIVSQSVDTFASEAPIHIESNRMTSTEKSNSVVFTGDVDAKQGDVRIRSDEMTVYYTTADSAATKPKDKKKSPPPSEKKASQQVEKLICIGNVEVTRGEWLGTSKKMIYLSKERQVILTDNAKAWQGQNMVSGDKIIYYLDEGRSEVIGDSKVTKAGDTEKGKTKPSRVNMTILQK